MPLCWIDDTGFHRATRREIRAYIEASMRGIFGLNAATPLGVEDAQWLDSVAGDYDQLVSVAGEVYAARSPAGAKGAALSRLVCLNGVMKNPPELSTGTATCTGTPRTLIAAGSRIGNATNPDAIFETIADATIGDADPGDDGTVDVEVRSTVTGPVPGDAGDLSVVLTVISGWKGVGNAQAVSLGNAGESDAELRGRRAVSVALASQGIVDGLCAHLLQLPDVTEAIVRENPEDTVQILDDGGPLAPHSINCIVRGGAVDVIAQTIEIRRALGCTTVGLISEEIVDSQGSSKTVRFDRPDGVPIYVEIHSAAPISSDDQLTVKKAIVARGNGLLVFGGAPMPGNLIGEDVAASDIYDAITALRATSLPKLKVSGINIGTAPAPTGDDDIEIPYNAIATWNADNITFVVDP